jgi:hypothetical protein
MSKASSSNNPFVKGDFVRVLKGQGPHLAPGAHFQVRRRSIGYVYLDMTIAAGGWNYDRFVKVTDDNRIAVGDRVKGKVNFLSNGITGVVVDITSEGRYLVIQRDQPGTNTVTWSAHSFELAPAAPSAKLVKADMSNINVGDTLRYIGKGMAAKTGATAVVTKIDKPYVYLAWDPHE